MKINFILLINMNILLSTQVISQKQFSYLLP